MNEKTVRPLKRAVIKEEYIAITGNMMEAIILNQMIYWSERVRDFDEFIKEEYQRRLLENGKEDNVPLLCGWIYKSAAELKAELMSMYSIKTIGRKLDDLVAKGFLSRRNNPKTLYDRKYQYRVDFTAIIDALAEYGYTLEGYKVELPSPTSKTGETQLEKPSETPELRADASKGQIDKCIGQNDEWKGQRDECIRHDDNCNRHSVAAIPEITSKTTPEITPSSPSYSPKPVKRVTRMEDKTGSVSEFLTAIGVDKLHHRDMVEPISALLTDLLLTGKVVRNQFRLGAIEKALRNLTAGEIDGVIDRFAKQGEKSSIPCPEDYLKTCLLHAGQAAEYKALAGKAGADGIHCGKPSYDIDGYVDLQMRLLHGEQY